MAPPAGPWGHEPWAAGPPAAPEAKAGSPWLVLLTVALAVVILAVAGIAIRAAAGRSRTDQVVEVPPRREPLPSTSVPRRSSPSTTAPSTPTTPTTGAGATPAPKLDAVTPRLKVTDLDGRFDITVPRAWLSVPTEAADQLQWVPFVERPTGEVETSGLTFAVRWADSDGCTLEQCAGVVLDRVTASTPGVSPTATPTTVGGQPAVRIEATAAGQRLVAWVVVKGDRYWVPQLRGGLDDFDMVLAVAEVVVASMSFG